MKKVLATLSAAAILAISAASPAMARCPAGTSYSCYQGFGGKVICGCR